MENYDLNTPIEDNIEYVNSNIDIIDWWVNEKKISIEIYSINTETGIEFGLEICDISGESVVILYESHDIVTERIDSWKTYKEAKMFAIDWLIENGYGK